MTSLPLAWWLGLVLLPGTPDPTDDRMRYYDRHGEGWFWYQDPPPTAPEGAPPKAPADSRPNTSIDPPMDPPTGPLAALAAFQRQLDVARARAVLHPTAAHVKAYLVLNQQALARAGAFAQAWQRVVWTTPALDTRLTYPVNDQAVQAFHDGQLRRVDAFLRETAQRYGLFFFFKASCAFCQRLAPVLKAFAEAYGFAVTAVSLDDGALPEFPRPRRNTDAALRLHVDTVPAVFLVEPRRRTLHPVAFGYVSGTELRQRIFTLLNPPPPLQQARTLEGVPHATQ